MRLTLPHELRTTLETELARAGAREIGGQLFGEQLAPSDFRVLEASVQRRGGSVATFSVSKLHAWFSAVRFFRRTKSEFVRFNYLGEWHSHPSFEIFPSGRDDRTMRLLASHPAFKGTFAVLMIAKLVNDRFTSRAWIFLPDGSHYKAEVVSAEDDYD